MSIKALQRRAREAQHWLGQCALPLWAEVGFLRDGGVLAALELNHRPGDDPKSGDVAAQRAIAQMFALAPAVGFDAEVAKALRARADAAAETAMEADLPSSPTRSLQSVCDELRLRLITLTTAAGEDAILTSRAASRTFDLLMDDFLTPEGGWIVGYDENGLPAGSTIPAALAEPIAAALEPLLPLAEA
ncbi:MAG: hypothetical protein AAFQ22_05850 [Pseudomonadota bacterium]